MMSVILKNTNNNKNKRNLINFLKRIKYSQDQFGNQIIFKSFLKYERFHIKKANKVFENTINIPCSTNLSIKETKKVVKIIRKFYSKN